MPFVDRLIGAAAGYGALWLVACAYRSPRHREGMGGGDPKLLGLLLVLIMAARGRAVPRTTALPLGS